MESNHTAEGIRTSRGGIRRLVVAGVVLGCSWTAAAFGASTLGVDCDQDGNEFLSRNIPAEKISVSVVDLTADESVVGIERSLDEVGGSDESIAPLLYLAPRVASILEDVFDEDSANTDPTATTRSSSVSPLADSADELIAPQSTEADSAIHALSPILRIQREMYRTDI